MKYLILSLFLIIIGCSNQPVKVINRYDGKSEKEMLKNKGTPESSDIIPLSQCWDEMRFPIQEYFPESQRNQTNVFVKELWWEEGNYYFTSWFKSTNENWIVLESLKWHKDVQF